MARVLETKDECERAEAALDRHYGRMRRIHEEVMADEQGMVYLEVAPAAPESDVRRTDACRRADRPAVSGGASTTAPRTRPALWTPSARSRGRIAADAYARVSRTISTLQGA